MRISEKIAASAIVGVSIALIQLWVPVVAEAESTACVVSTISIACLGQSLDRPPLPVNAEADTTSGDGAAADTRHNHKQRRLPLAVECRAPIGASPEEAAAICDGAAAGHTVPQPSPATVLAELKRMGLPRGRISFQPAWGGLVNKAEIFYTTVPRDRDRTIILLGRTVHVHMHITSYRWDFGDGADLVTATPGAPYPSHEVEHVYLHPGTFALTLSLTYGATFRVENGPEHPVDGVVTVDGEPVDLAIRNAHAQLVGG